MAIKYSNRNSMFTLQCDKTCIYFHHNSPKQLNRNDNNQNKTKTKNPNNKENPMLL